MVGSPKTNSGLIHGSIVGRSKDVSATFPATKGPQSLCLSIGVRGFEPPPPLFGIDLIALNLEADVGRVLAVYY